MQHENEDLTLIFDSFIKNGEVQKEKEIAKGFKVKLRALDTGELLIAESIMDKSTAPADIVAKVRAASILSQAIVAVNDVPIEREDYNNIEIRRRRMQLYTQLLKMPPVIIHKTYEFYIECVEDQNSKYRDFEKTTDQIKGF